MKGNAVVFDTDIDVSSLDKWEHKKYPATIINVSNIPTHFSGIEKGLSNDDWGNPGDPTANPPVPQVIPVTTYVSIAEPNVEIVCWGRTEDERDALADITLVYLNVPSALDLALKYGIRYQAGREPNIASASSEEVPGQDLPVYSATIDIGLNTELILLKSPSTDIAQLADVVATIDASLSS